MGNHATRRRRRTTAVRALAAGLALVVLAAAGVVLAVVFTWGDDDRAAGSRSRGDGSASTASGAPAAIPQAARDAALEFAGRAAREIVATRFDDLEAEVTTATALMTPEFAATYRQTTDSLRDAGDSAGTVVEAEVVGTGLIGISTDAADVLVFVDQSARRGEAEPTVTPSRFALALTRSGPDWLVGGMSLFAEDEPGTPEPDPARRQVIDAAETMVTAFGNYDYRDPQAGIDRVLDLATGGFATRFRDGAGDLARQATQARSVMRSEILASGLAQYDATSAVVLVATRGDVSNETSGDRPQDRSYRLRLTLTLVDGAWLTSDLRFVAAG